MGALRERLTLRGLRKKKLTRPQTDYTNVADIIGSSQNEVETKLARIQERIRARMMEYSLIRQHRTYIDDSELQNKLNLLIDEIQRGPLGIQALKKVSSPLLIESGIYQQIPIDLSHLDKETYQEWFGKDLKYSDEQLDEFIREYCVQGRKYAYFETSFVKVIFARTRRTALLIDMRVDVRGEDFPERKLERTKFFFTGVAMDQMKKLYPDMQTEFLTDGENLDIPLDVFRLMATLTSLIQEKQIHVWPSKPHAQRRE